MIDIEKLKALEAKAQESKTTNLDIRNFTNSLWSAFPEICRKLEAAHLLSDAAKEIVRTEHTCHANNSEEMLDLINALEVYESAERGME